MTAAAIEPAVREDAAALTEVIRAGFPPGVQDMTIYGAPGADAFVRREIGLGPALSERAYTVARMDGVLAGAIELRRVPGSLFLNYISVAPAAHGSGVGTALLREATEAVREPAHAEMRLDVFDDNDPARAWYERLGFAAVAATEWWTMDELLPGLAPEPVYVDGFAHAEACQAAYGFSELAVKTASGRHAVGRLGRQWFRLTSPEAVRDEGLGTALAALDSRRRVLALIPEGTLPPRLRPRARRVRRSLRMTVPLDALRAALADRAAQGAVRP